MRHTTLYAKGQELIPSFLILPRGTCSTLCTLKRNQFLNSSVLTSELIFLQQTTNNNLMQIFNVYAVIGGIDYEGEDFKSLRLFDCKSTAEAYEIYLTENGGYDYALIEVREVCMESALAA